MRNSELKCWMPFFPRRLNCLFDFRHAPPSRCTRTAYRARTANIIDTTPLTLEEVALLLKCFVRQGGPQSLSGCHFDSVSTLEPLFRCESRQDASDGARASRAVRCDGWRQRGKVRPDSCDEEVLVRRVCPDWAQASARTLRSVVQILPEATSTGLAGGVFLRKLPAWASPGWYFRLSANQLR